MSIRDGHKEWTRKYRPKKYTDAWDAARGVRAAHRSSTPQQSRNKEGFIVKVDPATGTAVLHDPGEIDRWLWMQANPDDSQDG